MSRQPSNSPENSSCLPRRRFLQAITAIPVAAASLPGQALSASPQDNPLLILEDERFEAFRRLTTEEWRLIEIANIAEYGDPERDAKVSASGVASDAIEAFMQEHWAKPVKSPADLLLRARFMEFADLRYNIDNDIWRLYANPAKNLVSGHLEFFAANPSFGVLAGHLGAQRFLGVTAEEMKLAIATDSRFAQLDNLIRQSIALEVREEAAFLEHDAATIESCRAEYEVEPDGPCPWVILHARLRADIDDIAREQDRKPRDWLDLALQNKLADYYVTVGDADGGDFNEIVASFIRHSLRYWGFDPQKPIDELKPPKPAPTVPKEPSPRQQLRQLTFDTRAKIRKAEKRLRNALTREARLGDGTPAHAKAVMTTNRRQAELNKLTDKLMPKFGSFPMADDYQLQCELLAAHRPDFLSSPSCDRAGKILQHLLRFARKHGDWCVEDAAEIISRQASV